MGGTFFWLSVALLLGYAAYFYFSDKETSLRWLRRLWEHLVAQWQLLFGAVRAVGMRNANRLPASKKAPRAGDCPPLYDVCCPGACSPRTSACACSTFSFWKLLKSATWAANPPKRRIVLRHVWNRITPPPEETETIEGLTAAFVDVRYAGRSVTAAFR